MSLVPDDHDPQSEGHYIELRLEYDDTADGEVTLGRVEVHSHHVPDDLYVDTLLILAREVVSRSMQENMFKEEIPEQVRRTAARIMSTKFLADRLQSVELGSTEPVDMTVPDDARELFGEE